MSENKMGYRGSKSEILNKSVKEQRVDGSYFGYNIKPRLRCTLMDFERNYQINIPSKQTLILKRNFCIKSTTSITDLNKKLNPL
jgi:hypothetical protein